MKRSKKLNKVRNGSITKVLWAFYCADYMNKGYSFESFLKDNIGPVVIDGLCFQMNIGRKFKLNYRR
jgi:hypothetical protein